MTNVHVAHLDHPDHPELLALETKLMRLQSWYSPAQIVSSISLFWLVIYPGIFSLSASVLTTAAMFAGEKFALVPLGTRFKELYVDLSVTYLDSKLTAKIDPDHPKHGYVWRRNTFPEFAIVRRMRGAAAVSGWSAAYVGVYSVLITLIGTANEKPSVLDGQRSTLWFGMLYILVAAAVSYGLFTASNRKARRIEPAAPAHRKDTTVLTHGLMADVVWKRIREVFLIAWLVFTGFAFTAIFVLADTSWIYWSELYGLIAMVLTLVAHAIYNRDI